MSDILILIHSEMNLNQINVLKEKWMVLWLSKFPLTLTHLVWFEQLYVQYMTLYPYICICTTLQIEWCWLMALLERI